MCFPALAHTPYWTITALSLSSPSARGNSPSNPTRLKTWKLSATWAYYGTLGALQYAAPPSAWEARTQSPATPRRKPRNPSPANPPRHACTTQTPKAHQPLTRPQADRLERPLLLEPPLAPGQEGSSSKARLTNQEEWAWRRPALEKEGGTLGKRKDGGGEE